MNWNSLRKDFPVTSNMAYFQSAGMSPIPTPVLEKIVSAYIKINQYGDTRFPDDLEEYKRLLQLISRLIGSLPDDLAMMPNNSIAMSVIALSLKEKYGTDLNIISFAEEFPSNTVPFEYQGIPVQYCQTGNGRYTLSDIIGLINEKTRAVVISQVQYGTGFRADLREIGEELRKREIIFVVNATQAFPIFPADVRDDYIDVLTCSVHKWGFAGHAGTIFYTSPEFREKFRPPIAGWLSLDTGNKLVHEGKNEPLNLIHGGGRYHTGTFNLQAMLGLHESLQYLDNIGLENIRERILSLTDYLIESLQGMPVNIYSPVDHRKERSGIVSIGMPDGRNREMIVKLEKDNIYTSLRLEKIRIAVNFFNDTMDIDRLCMGIADS